MKVRVRDMISIYLDKKSNSLWFYKKRSSETVYDNEDTNYENRRESSTDRESEVQIRIYISMIG